MIARNCKDFYETGVTEKAAAPDKGTEDLSELSNHDLRLTPDPYCDVCQKNYADPKPEQLVIYLHALSYKVFKKRSRVVVSIIYLWFWGALFRRNEQQVA